MTDHSIRQMVNTLIDNNMIDKKNIHQSIYLLQNYWNDKVAHIWCTDDVITEAERNGITLTEYEALTILDAVGKNIDSNVGVNWDVLSCYIDEYVTYHKSV